jgi:hypothetical protein
MRRLRITGLALLALLALGAFAASTASAEEGVLPLKTLHFNILGKKGTLENNLKEKITCNELKGEGKFEEIEKTGHDSHGSATLDFLECLVGGFLIWSLGEKVPAKLIESLILVPVLFLICLINSTTLLFGLYVEVMEPGVHLDNTSIGLLTIVLGSVIGDILAAANTPAKLYLIHFNGKEGKQEFTECKDEKGGVKKHSLTSTNATHTQKEPASEQTESVLIQFLENQELMDA